MQHYAVKIRRSCWIGDHLDVHVSQKLGTRAFRAAQRVLFGQARKVRFKGKSNERGSGGGMVVWSGGAWFYQPLSTQKIR